VDGIERLWQFRQVGHYAVYAIYGMDVVLIRTAWLRQIVPFGLVTLLASALTYGMSRRCRPRWRDIAVPKTKPRSRAFAPNARKRSHESNRPATISFN